MVATKRQTVRARGEHAAAGPRPGSTASSSPPTQPHHPSLTVSAPLPRRAALRRAPQVEGNYFSSTFFNQTLDITEAHKIVDFDMLWLIATLLALVAGVGERQRGGGRAGGRAAGGRAGEAAAGAGASFL